MTKFIVIIPKKDPYKKHQEILTNISKFNLTRVLLIMNVKYTN